MPRKSVKRCRDARTVDLAGIDPNGADGRQWEAAHRYFDKAWDMVLGSPRKRHPPGGQPQDWTAWLQQLKQMNEAK